MPDFNLKTLAQLSGVPPLRARNWTLGRPLMIRPSVRMSPLKGSRSLFSEDDVFKMAIANRLREGGVSFRVIRRVIEEFDPSCFADGDADWLIVRVSGEEISHDEILEENLELALELIQRSDRKPMTFLVHLSEMIGEVQKRMREFEEQREAKHD